MMTESKGQLLFRAKQAGLVRDIAISRGGTGELRKPLSTKEQAHRKNRRLQAKKSRQFNRKGGR